MIARGTSRQQMAGGYRRTLSAMLTGAAFCALLAASPAAIAQSIPAGLGAKVSVPKDAQLFLEADTVTYDSNSAVVTASGGVQIDYGGYKLVSRDVIYNQKTHRLVAKGDVELVQPDGNIVYADAADITDDFANAFIKALRIETVDNTRFAAANGIRQNGNVTTFQRGVYTACKPCQEHPERAPLIQVKARKIVWDQTKKEIYYYDAKFEFFGAPIAYLPYFQAPDPTVKRKSGFLAPSFISSNHLGFGARVPYFIALSDSYDATIAGTYLSRQGFLGEAEFRQALSNGMYSVQVAGISQRDSEAFRDNGLTSPDFLNQDRGMIGTRGRFDLSPSWTFGWDVLAQTDQDFSATYKIANFNQIYHTSEVYLSGLGDRSFFDLRAQKFDVQIDNNPLAEDVQPTVLPTLDYQNIDENPVLGGEAGVNVNVVNLRRDETNPALSLICEPAFFLNGACIGGNYRRDYFRRDVLEGNYSRASTEAYWKRTLTTQGGLLITPSLSVRGDIYKADESIDDFSTTYNSGVSVDRAGGRFMPTAGLEARYPYLIQTATSSHVIEPIAQLLVRPNEMDAGLLPNEDAQSLVFNTSNLFQADKFSGYDRIEGGTRANVGLRYVGTFDTGYSLDALVGQSYQLAGENSFAQTDLALAGIESGLETARSDYVGSVALLTPIGLQFGAQARLDDESWGLERTDLSTAYKRGRFSGSVAYSFIAAQPISGFPVDRQQVTTTAAVKLTDEWSAFGSLGYDLENSEFIQRSFGLAYMNDCFSLSASYQNITDRYEQNPSESTLLFRVGLRTIADADFSYGLGSKN